MLVFRRHYCSLLWLYQYGSDEEQTSEPLVDVHREISYGRRESLQPLRVWSWYPTVEHRSSEVGVPNLIYVLGNLTFAFLNSVPGESSSVAVERATTYQQRPSLALR